MRMKRFTAWLAIFSIVFAAVAQAGPFVPGQVLTAAQLNSVVDSKCTNAACAITGGTATGITIDNSVIGGTTPAPIYNTLTNTIAASGTNQATATALTSQQNRISTAPVGSGVILMTALRGGLVVGIDNDTANAVNVYPQLTGTINQAAANTPLVVPPNGSVLLFSTDTLNWDSVLDSSPSFQSVTLYGTLTPNSASGVVGTVTNDNAQAGSIGEYTSSSVASTAVSLTTASAVNITSLPLAAGDYDVQGTCIYQTAATTNVTLDVCGLSATSGTFGADGSYTRQTYSGLVPGAVEYADQVTQNVRFSLASPTTVYLVASSTFTVSTQTAGGFMRVRRVR